MQSIINDITGYSISRNLLGQALLATAGFEAPGTTYPCATHDNALVREHYYLQASCGLGARLDGKANSSELLINIVTAKEPKVLTGSDQ
ncbi:hypothetical protein, partial [Budvicia aquatica]